MRFLHALGVGVLTAPLFAAVPTQAGPSLDRVLRPACDRDPTCIIRNNHGGEISLFQQAARELLREGKRLVIDGRCESACVILADMARPYACLTPRAVMAVHQASIVRLSYSRNAAGRAERQYELVGRSDPPQSRDIDQWVADHGGYPPDGLLLISLPDAQQFWPMCEDGQVPAWPSEPVEPS
jgi:hypothetical protein